MAIFAVVDAQGNIVNRIVLDTSDDWQAPEGQSLIEEVDTTLEIGGTYLNGIYTKPVSAPSDEMQPPPPSVLPQDLMAQFTTDDATKIQVAISANVQFWLLWQAMTAQKDPMLVTNQRFLAGWQGLIQVLGAERMKQISSALGVVVA